VKLSDTWIQQGAKAIPDTALPWQLTFLELFSQFRPSSDLKWQLEFLPRISFKLQLK
jgi:hypothetical protein